MAFLSAKTFQPVIEVFMRKLRKVSNPAERNERLVREAQTKKDGAAADEIAVDRMVRRNIEQFGP